MCVAAVVLVGLSSEPASAEAHKKPRTRRTTLTFDELSSAQVDGLHIRGVRFHFTVGGVASTDALYGTLGPGTTTYITEPSLEGDATGTLKLTFAHPTRLLQFGLALNTFGSLNPGATVQLYNRRGRLRATMPVNTSSPSSFTEGQFTYRGNAVSSAVITFAPGAGRFVIDNLTYRRPVRCSDDVPNLGGATTRSARTSGWRT